MSCVGSVSGCDIMDCCMGGLVCNLNVDARG